MCTSSSRFKQLIGLIRTFEECKNLLCLQEMDLKVQEATLAEEQAHDLHPPDRWDLSVKLEETSTRVDGTKGECVAEAEQLS
jgi:hypothetical protein